MASFFGAFLASALGFFDEVTEASLAGALGLLLLLAALVAVGLAAAFVFVLVALLLDALLVPDLDAGVFEADEPADFVLEALVDLALLLDAAVLVDVLDFVARSDFLVPTSFLSDV